ncbi:PhlB family protein [Streptomyces paradoxus]|uniref:hypothetical protein n=1 Tax=Streptomyces paradoxus TaxID=66375 RepID=UPI00380EC1BE
MLRTESREHNKLREDTEAAALDMMSTAEPPPPAVCRDLFFQRCLWCGTPAYRRSFCRACGATTFKRERSCGAGVLVRRIGQTPLNTWFVAMAEGFNLLCQVTGTEPVVVAVGARVRVVRGAAPRGQGFPLVELTCRATSLERWW